MKDLTEDKRKLEECIQNHTHELQTMQAKLDNMKNHNTQEFDEVRLQFCTYMYE